MDPGAVQPDLARSALNHEPGGGNLVLHSECVDVERLIARGGALVVPEQSREKERSVSCSQQPEVSRYQTSTHWTFLLRHGLRRTTQSPAKSSAKPSQTVQCPRHNEREDIDTARRICLRALGRYIRKRKGSIAEKGNDDGVCRVIFAGQGWWYRAQARRNLVLEII